MADRSGTSTVRWSLVCVCGTAMLRFQRQMRAFDGFKQDMTCLVYRQVYLGSLICEQIFKKFMNPVRSSDGGALMVSKVHRKNRTTVKFQQQPRRDVLLALTTSSWLPQYSLRRRLMYSFKPHKMNLDFCDKCEIISVVLHRGEWRPSTLDPWTLGRLSLLSSLYFRPLRCRPDPVGRAALCIISYIKHAASLI